MSEKFRPTGRTDEQIRTMIRSSKRPNDRLLELAYDEYKAWEKMMTTYTSTESE